MDETRRICLIGSLGQDISVLQAAKNFQASVVTSNTGHEYLNDHSITYFVIDQFEGQCFDVLFQHKCRILGPTALKELAHNCDDLPSPERLRPVYSLSMKGLIICFTGYRKKTDLRRLAGLVHFMGGSIRREMECKITHLVANCPGGEKYQYASTFNIPIMAESWITIAWENRDVIGYSCRNSDVISSHKLRFGGSRVCFLGFSPEETDHMSQVLLSNGGIVSSIDDSQCTHLVVDDSNTLILPENIPSKAHVVKAEWFWASVQYELCADEKEYRFEDHFQIRKRRSSISDAGLLSASGSYLDCTLTPQKDLLDEVENRRDSGDVSVSARRQVFLELVQTETNYVSILHTIVSLFKTPLEEMMTGENMLLNATELKIIFGNLPPIYELHCNMLEDLKWGVQNWQEDFSVGNVILKFAPELVKTYPPFINYFEKSKETLEHCDLTKPRFHAFLKIKQTKPECGRQSLKELLIRPVQRLPSISLLLNDLLKHTDKQNPDRSALEKALVSIKEVMTHINEDKRKTEAQLAMFDLFNDIENCPAHLISSHRSLVSKCECVELTDVFSTKKGNVLVLLLFNDTLEVCKKRAKAFNTFRGTKPSSLQKVNRFRKQYKHVRLMPLSNLRKVIDIKDIEESQNVFALLCRSNQSLKETFCSFSIADETDKQSFLKQMCKQMAHTVCTPDPDDFYEVMDAQEGSADTASNTSIRSTHSFTKAFRFASKTKVKVGRALSMKTTPSKFTRAVSTIRPFSAQKFLTPKASRLTQLRLQSCANLSELNCTPLRDTPAPPLSDQPTRKKLLGSAFSVSSLKHL